MGWNGEREEEREKRALNGEQTSLGSQKEVVWPPPLSLSFASSSFSSYSCSTLPAKLLYEETTAGK